VSDEHDKNYYKEHEKNKDIMDNLQNEKKKIHEYQAKLDELDDDGQNNFDNVLADEEDDPGIDDDHENQNKQK